MTLDQAPARNLGTLPVMLTLLIRCSLDWGLVMPASGVWAGAMRVTRVPARGRARAVGPRRGRGRRDRGVPGWNRRRSGMRGRSAGRGCRAAGA